MVKKKFDLRTHVRDSKGRVVKKQPYRLKIEAGRRLFERPVGSGMWYYENGEMTPDTKKKSKQAAEAEVKAPEFDTAEEKAAKKEKPAPSFNLDVKAAEKTKGFKDGQKSSKA